MKKSIIQLFSYSVIILLNISALMAQNIYTITFNAGNFGVSINGDTPTWYMSSQNAINFIRGDAGGNPCTIQFESGSNVLDLYQGDGETPRITFENDATEAWGKITLTGKAKSASVAINGIILINEDVSIDSKADISATASGFAIRIRKGTLNIISGKISATRGAALYNDGNVTISGGTISATTGRAIDHGAGTLTINGGTVSATTGVAIWNDINYRITISGNATVTSANESTTSGTIYLKDVSETTSYRLKIEGGTIRNTATGGNAICNASYGSVNISGGYIYTNGGVTVFNAGRGEININDGTVDVGGTNGIAVRNETGFGKVNINGGKVKAAGQGSRAVYNNATGEVNISGGEVSSHNWIAVVNYANGKINVSGTALITSANTNATSGSIFLFNNSVDDNCRLEISGGTIENTSAAGNAIRNESNGSMEITGGKVLARNGFAINNNGAGLLTIGNNSIVFAYGSAATDVVSGSPDPTGDAVIAAWNMMHDKYDFGSDQDIIKLPATAITVWKKQGGKSGISVKNGLNTGFIPVPGVTVKGEIFIVSFAGEGINIPQQEIEEGDLVICPPDPERPNYDFNGWFTDNGTFTNEWDFDNDGVTQNMTLYAKWTPKGAIAETGNDAMRIYPNPTTGEFRISPLPLRDFSQRGKKTDFVNGELKIENVEIFNVMGQSIGANLRIYPNNTINISHLPTGVYFVKITTDSGVVIRKVIKSEL